MIIIINLLSSINIGRYLEVANYSGNGWGYWGQPAFPPSQWISGPSPGHL